MNREKKMNQQIITIQLRNVFLNFVSSKPGFDITYAENLQVLNLQVRNLKLLNLKVI